MAKVREQQKSFTESEKPFVSPETWGFIKLLEGVWKGRTPDQRKSNRYTVTRFLIGAQRGSTKTLKRGEGRALLFWMRINPHLHVEADRVLRAAYEQEGQLPLLEDAEEINE